MGARIMPKNFTETKNNGEIVMKKFIAGLISFAMICTISAHSFAAESPYDENGSRVVYSWENPNWEEELYGDTGTGDSGLLRYGEREEVTVIGTEEKMFFTDPEQLEDGYSFSKSGGAVYVTIGAGHPVEISVSLGWGPVSISVAPGKASTSVGGLIINIPGDGRYHKVKLLYKCEFVHKKIDQYKGPEFIRTVYVTDYTVKSIKGIEYTVKS